MPQATSTISASRQEKQFFGHPRGLSTLFFTEMWERFSYYGMRGLLVLYLTAAIADGGMAMTDAKAGAIYGLYTAGVYLLALPGGWIADRLIGQQKAVFYGGVVIAAGHFSMAIPSTATFFLGLLLIILGTGLLKPNVSAIVGDLYPEKGARRDAGFSIFYMGINLGAFFGPIICGYLGENVNWHLGFSAAGIGMVLGLIQYRLGQIHLGGAGTHQATSPEDRSAAVRVLVAGIALVTILVAALWLLQNAGTIALSFESVAGTAGVIIVSIAVLYFGYVLLGAGLDPAEKKRVIYIFLLFLGAALFWGGFEQAGSSMNLFAERLTDRTLGGWEMPASWLQSVNALFIIMLAPVFGALWVWLKHREPSIPVKFGFGLALLGAGFFVLAWGASFAETGLVSPMWLIVTYFLHTCGELCLSPVGLSSVTKLSPERLVGQMMGVWFMGTALGNLVAGLVAGQFETMPLVQLFGVVASVVVGAGLIFLVLAKPIRKLGGGVH
jgi:POT family proton-dependent oligopeptide transporter